MPSQHTQVMAFAAALYMGLQLIRRKHGLKVSTSTSLMQLAEALSLCLLTIAVAYSRMYLGYHDLPQVAAGAAAGVVMAALVCLAMPSLVRITHGTKLLQTSLARWLCLKDTLEEASPLLFEYDAYNTGSRQPKLQKVHNTKTQ